MSGKKSYSEMISLPTYAERLEYLRCSEEERMHNEVLKKSFYLSPEWKHMRNYVIFRDYGCDLACEGMEIGNRIIVHHINPLTERDIISHSDKLLDPDNLVCVSIQSHNYIHYGYYRKYDTEITERTQGDTRLW